MTEQTKLVFNGIDGGSGDYLFAPGNVSELASSLNPGLSVPLRSRSSRQVSLREQDLLDLPVSTPENHVQLAGESSFPKD